METPLIEISRQQRESWNKFSPGWKKWDDLFMDFLKPKGDEIIRLLNPKGNQVVLDIASGTGEPGLSIASRLSDGVVVIADLSENMVSIARENAVLRGIKNIQTSVCDVSDLPYSDEAFDLISCRFGFMFFPDMQLAAREMNRVLKQSGRVATSVWNIPEKNFWITAIMGAIKKNMDIPAPPPGAPGMFRCASPNLMHDLFVGAGFKNVSVTEVAGRMNCQTVDVYWDVMTEVAAPVVAALSEADHATRENIKDDVFRAVRQQIPDGDVVIESSALIVYGEK